MNSVERYYQKKKRRKKKAKVLFFTLLFALFLLSLAILSMTVFFNADTIEVEGNTRYSADEILEIGGLKIGQNLFRLDKFEVIDQMKTLPYIKEVTIRRKLPNTLKIDVVENQPVVWVECMGQAALMNEEYRVLEFAELIPIDPEAQVQEEPEEEKQEEPAEEETTSEEEPAAEEADGEQEEEQEQEASGGLVIEETLEEEEKPCIADTKKPAVEGNVPFLKGVEAGEMKVGDFLTFKEEKDYTDFLKTLYEAFTRNGVLEWGEVTRVYFKERYDITLQYREKITIDFGTLDRVETKLELAEYLLEQNGYGRQAVVDVSDTERVYFRPQTE
ncbi:MAG: FtsQ-type POTRA domain-containing protein [Clostridia bacterium]|nr:FtsQ-type POTRA domain-containing protein [Clostridia bacterium]